MFIEFDNNGIPIVDKSVYTISYIVDLKKDSLSKELGYDNLILLILLYIDPASAFINLNKEEKIEQLEYQGYIKNRDKIKELFNKKEFLEVVENIKKFLYPAEYQLLESYKKKINEISSFLDNNELSIETVNEQLKIMEKAPIIMDNYMKIKTIVEEQKQIRNRTRGGGDLTWIEKQTMRE